MVDVLFSIGPFKVHAYGLMMGIGIMMAFIVGLYRAKKKGLDAEFAFDVGFWCGVIGLISTRLMFYIVEIPDIIKDPSILWNFNYGYVVYGGIIGGVTTGLIYCKKKKKNFMDYFDLVMPSIALAQGIGRIGCFLVGCCYGRETSSAFSVTYHHSNLAPNGVKLIPTQLISSGADILLFFLLVLYDRKNQKRGRIGAMYFILYSIGRFLVEFLRNDYRGSVGFLSTSQFISIGILAVGILLYVTAKEKTEEVPESEEVA